MQYQCGGGGAGDGDNGAAGNIAAGGVVASQGGRLLYRSAAIYDHPIINHRVGGCYRQSHNAGNLACKPLAYVT